MTPPLDRTLAPVGRLLADAAEPWWIVTGAAAALYGVPGTVADVDLLCGTGDARLLLGRDAEPGVPHPRFRSSVFGTLRGLPLPVDVMAEFALLEDGDWRPVTFATRETVMVAGVMLYLPSRHELAALLDRIGRAKDRRRAATLLS